MKKINKKKIFFVSITFLITLCLFFYFIFSYYSTPIQPRTIHKKNKKNTSYPTVSFVAVGDNIIHENVYQYALKQGNDTTYNFKPCYQNIKKYISDHDLAYINQETLIAGDSYGIKGYPNFNSPESLINDLQDTGFNMVSSATNHSMDLGKNALISSAHIWKQHSDILFSGLYENQEDRQTIRVIEKNGIRFSLLAYTFGVNETTNYKSIQKQLKTYPYILGQLNKEQIKEDVNNAKAQSDVVIVAVHNQLEGMVCFDFVKKEDEISIENIQYVPLVNHYNDNVVTIYSLKEYTSTLASQHSILKDQADIIKEFKNYVKQMISNDDIDIEM